MIPYADLERALQRWKARQGGATGDDGGGAEIAAAETSDRVTVEADYVESEAEEAFPSRNAGTNEILIDGDLEDN